MLATRCPACTTAFKIVPDQLKLSQGWVRCGKCGEVFNATQHFVQVPPAVAAAASAAAAQTAALPVATSPVAGSPAAAAASPAARSAAVSSSSPSSPPSHPLLAPEAALAVAAAAMQAPVWQRIAPDASARTASEVGAAAGTGLAQEVASLLAIETKPLVAKQVTKPTTGEAADAKRVRLPSADPNPFQSSATLASTSAQPASTPANPEFAHTASSAADAAVDVDIDDQSPQTLLPALEIDLPIDHEVPPDMRNRRAGDLRLGDQRGGDSRLGDQRLGDSRFGGIPSRTADSAVRMGSGTRPQRRRQGDSDDDSVPLERDLRGSEPAFLKQARRREKWQSWPVRLLLLILLLAGLGGLIAQTAYFLRDDIATHYPAAKPLLAAACAEFSQLQCALDAVERLQDIVIESSALNPIAGKDGAASTSLELSAVLKNRLRSANRWPALEVTLTDARDTVIVRKVLRVQEYLVNKPLEKPALEPAMRGFGEYNARLVIDTQNLEVAGYRLAIFYP